MTLRFLILTLLLLSVAWADNRPFTTAIIYPGDMKVIGFQLYYASGPYMGQPAQLANVGVEYLMYGWRPRSGGHFHDWTPNQYSGRPYLSIWPVGGVDTGQYAATAYTNDAGQVTFEVKAPRFAGYYYTTGWITSCNVSPYITCYQIFNEVDMQVQNDPADVALFDPLDGTFVGLQGRWIQIHPHGGFYNVNGLLDTLHAGEGSFVGAATPIYDIADTYRFDLAKPRPFNISAASLPTGGFYDRKQAGNLWSLINSDKHALGYTFDIYSPQSAVEKDALKRSLLLWCGAHKDGGVALFDFFTHQAPTATEMTNSKSYLWHISCADPSVDRILGAYDY